MEIDEAWLRRFEQRERPALPWPEWRGEPLGGKRLVVWPEQGLGDKIMFARWFPLLAPDARVTVLCEPALVRLFQANFAFDVVEASGKTEFPDPDCWTMYGSLPLRTGQRRIPPSPYLARPEPAPIAGRIGVCTRGSPVHPNDANRSLPPDAAAALLSLPGAVSLHVDDTGARDFLETARLMAGLDAVVTVDTALAHLAGALGVPVWILLPSQGLDWRWGEAGETTPWYASARLVRQQAAEPWAEVVGRVIGDLGAAAAAR